MPVFEERFQVEAPAETVWEFLVDPARLAPCLPGCQALEVVDPKTYRVTLGVKVGFLSTTQDMRMTLVEMDRPRRLVAVGRGEDRRIGSQIAVGATLERGPGSAAGARTGGSGARSACGRPSSSVPARRRTRRSCTTGAR